MKVKEEPGYWLTEDKIAAYEAENIPRPVG